MNPFIDPATAAEKNRQIQREVFMERIRSRSSSQKTFPELAKSMRGSLMEKRYNTDAVEKTNLQTCLDSMHQNIKVSSRQSLVERLESLSRQLGLKFMDDSRVLFISTDMFFLEIILDQDGTLKDVKVHHESKVEQQSCTELLECLKRGDFKDFMTQLEGFSSIYQLNAEPKVKTKAFDAMQSMEADLLKIFQGPNSVNRDMTSVINNLGEVFVIKRRGGHAMRLLYYVTPYDLINTQSKSIENLTQRVIKNVKLGFSLTVHLEASSANKLQIAPTVTFAKESQSGLEVPVYAPLTQVNSMLLPATFVLKLNRPVPVCLATWRKLNFSGNGAVVSTMGCSNVPSTSSGSNNNTVENTSSANSNVGNIINLSIQIASDQHIQYVKKGLYVRLPDQTHCYYFTENKPLEVIRIMFLCLLILFLQLYITISII